MRKLGRLLLWAASGAVFLAGVVLIALNLYVQSQGTHSRIQQELSQRLNTPLRLRQISVTPWGGLKLKGITIPQERGKLGGNFLQAETFQLRVEFWSLFSDRLVIRQVSLVKPEVVWAQNAAGKWRLPELPRAQAKVSAHQAPASAAVAPAPTTPAAASSPVAPPAPASPRDLAALPPPQPFTPEVRRVNLKHGSFTFLDSAGRVIAKFLGLDFDSSFRTATAIKGTASVERISLRDKFFIEKLRSPLHYDPAQLIFSNISARAAGGEMSGHFTMQLLAEDSPFVATVKFHDLDAEKLITNAGGPAGMMQGKVDGSLEARGKSADPNALAGKGEIVVRDAKLQQYSLLVALGQILQIDELTQLHLEQAQANYRITPGVVRLDELLLRSPNIRLSASGTISFSGRLRLDAQLALNEKIRRQLFSPIRDNFQPLNEPGGFAAVNFKVSGTVDRPKTDLMEKVVGGDLGSVISSFFGAHPKKRRPQSPPPASPSPAASTAPSPNELVATPIPTATP